VELAILASFAVLAAVIVSSAAERGMLILLTFPMALAAMLMGAKRTGQLSASPVAVEVKPARSDEQAV
jgi:hypothetical protein